MLFASNGTHNYSDQTRVMSILVLWNFSWSLKWSLPTNVSCFKGCSAHRRPWCNGNTLIYKRPPGQLIHPCSLCVNVINAVYLIDTWHHTALKPHLLISCWHSRNSCIYWICNLLSTIISDIYGRADDGWHLLPHPFVDSCLLGRNLVLVWINHHRKSPLQRLALSWGACSCTVVMDKVTLVTSAQLFRRYHLVKPVMMLAVKKTRTADWIPPPMGPSHKHSVDVRY